MTPDICPLCNADLRGDPIPEDHRHWYNATHYLEDSETRIRYRLVPVESPGGWTPRPGWEFHEDCGGTAGAFRKVPCPDCVSGEVPSDELVEAVQQAAGRNPRWFVDTTQARAALLAARRHEDTARNTGVTP